MHRPIVWPRGAERLIYDSVGLLRRDWLALRIHGGKVFPQLLNDRPAAFRGYGKRLRQGADADFFLLGYGAPEQAFDSKPLLRGKVFGLVDHGRFSRLVASIIDYLHW